MSPRRIRAIPDHRATQLLKGTRRLAEHPRAAGGRADTTRHHPPTRLAAGYLGHADPWGRRRAVFTVAGTLNREDWSLTWNLPVDGGWLLISREIRIQTELGAVLQP
jgi:hypothetical protein